MATMKFLVRLTATKADALFLTPTVAVEKNISEVAIRFALWYRVFSIEIEKN